MFSKLAFANVDDGVSTAAAELLLRDKHYENNLLFTFLTGSIPGQASIALVKKHHHHKNTVLLTSQVRL